VTEPLLFLPWAVKRALPTKLRDSIQNIMIGLGRSEAGKEILTAAEATGMGKAEDKDYNPHRRMMTAVFGGSGIAR
jgi:ABC-type phosphate/phosphonate transport system substrate-binding protein